jgi:hypothetical protein
MRARRCVGAATIRIVVLVSRARARRRRCRRGRIASPLRGAVVLEELPVRRRLPQQRREHGVQDARRGVHLVDGRLKVGARRVRGRALERVLVVDPACARRVSLLLQEEVRVRVCAPVSTLFMYTRFFARSAAHVRVICACARAATALG